MQDLGRLLLLDPGDAPFQGSNRCLSLEQGEVDTGSMALTPFELGHATVLTFDPSVVGEIGPGFQAGNITLAQ